MQIGTFFVFEFANNKNILFVFWKAGAAFHFNVCPAFHFKSYPDESRFYIGRDVGFPFQSGLYIKAGVAMNG